MTGRKAKAKSKTQAPEKPSGEPVNAVESSDEDEVQDPDHISDDEEGGIRIGDIYIPPAPRPACSNVTDGPRLIITHIENLNFKSYAGRQVLGPFHKCFTSIVGPNGSGKSNVIDSMLFVFGYRASKIRSKKISVLLHSSAEHPNVTSCTVAVHFALINDEAGDPDKYTVVPGSEIVVARTAFKDNSSCYTINNKRVQFKEVAKLLRGHGIDLDHNRFLILQGEVEQIAMMKPKGQTEHDTGMLEFLEDIVGTSRFKIPIEKLQKRVEELNEERSEKLNRVKIVEKEKSDLEGPMKEAVEYLKLENELTELQNVLYQKYCRDRELQVEEKEKKKKAIDDGMQDLKDQLKELSSEIRQKNSVIAEESKNFHNLVNKTEQLNVEFSKANAMDAGLLESIVQMNSKRKNLREVLKQETSKLEDLEELPKKNEQEIAELQRTEGDMVAAREKAEAALNKIMASLRTETQALQDSKDQLQTKLIGLKKTVDETKSAYGIAKSELDLYLSKENSEKTKLEQYEKNFETTTKTLTERKNQVKELQTQVPALEHQLREAQGELNKVRTEEVQVTGKLRAQRAQVEEIRSSMQATRSRNRVLDSLMQLKRSGQLPGIFGRLGDLGAIDQKYDVAVSTACGPLDNIVVDTVNTAQECIEYLRKNDIGRTTIIALEKQQRWLSNCNSQIQTPENVPRLFDLIRVNDDRVRPAFYFGLRDTLVAKDLEQATRIAYGRTRQRVVTLNGELIEPSGTMSGGGKTVLKGRMGQCVVVSNETSPREMEQMEQVLAELDARSRHLREHQASLEDKVKKLTQELNVAKLNQNKFSMELKSLGQQEPVLRRQLAEQKERLKAAAPDPGQVKSLNSKVEQLKKEFDKAEAAAEVVEVKVNDIHKEIMKKTSGPMKTAQKKLDEASKKLDKARQDMTKLKVASKTAARNSKKTKEKITNIEQELHDLEKNLLKVKDDQLKSHETARQLCTKITESSASKGNFEQKLKSLKAELTSLTKEEMRLKSSKIEIDQKIENINGVIHELKSQLPVWKKKLHALKLQAIPGQTEAPKELPVLSIEELEEVDVKKMQFTLTAKESRLAENKPNLGVIQEYLQKETQYQQRHAELQDITKRRDEHRQLFDDLCRKRKTEFMDGYTTITRQLKEMYQMITMGGDAELELVDTLDPFSEGILFSVRPPKKSWKNISNLSGGEKTLSSLALVFALHYYKPTPLYVMDEIDAALDFKNVSIVGNYIKERTKNAQFIIISLRSNMFELADTLVGIYKTYNCTKSVTIHPKRYGVHDKQSNSQPTHEYAQRRSTNPPSNVLVEMDINRPRKVPANSATRRSLQAGEQDSGPAPFVDSNALSDT